MTLGVNARLLAHEGHEHKVTGTVRMAAVDHVMLKDKDEGMTAKTIEVAATTAAK